MLEEVREKLDTTWRIRFEGPKFAVLLGPRNDSVLQAVETTLSQMPGWTHEWVADSTKSTQLWMSAHYDETVGRLEGDGVVSPEVVILWRTNKDKLTSALPDTARAYISRSRFLPIMPEDVVPTRAFWLLFRDRGVGNIVTEGLPSEQLAHEIDVGSRFAPFSPGCLPLELEHDLKFTWTAQASFGRSSIGPARMRDLFFRLHRHLFSLAALFQDVALCKRIRKDRPLGPEGVVSFQKPRFHRVGKALQFAYGGDHVDLADLAALVAQQQDVRTCVVCRDVPLRDLCAAFEGVEVPAGRPAPFLLLETVPDGMSLDLWRRLSRKCGICLKEPLENEQWKTLVGYVREGIVESWPETIDGLEHVLDQLLEHFPASPEHDGCEVPVSYYEKNLGFLTYLVSMSAAARLFVEKRERKNQWTPAN